MIRTEPRSAFAWALLLLPILSLAAPLLVDDFTGRLNAHYWSTYGWGGPGVAQQRGRVVVSLPDDAEGEEIFVAGLLGAPVVRGDFDVRVDYALPNWPASSGVRVGIIASDVERTTNVNVERVGFGVGDFPGAPREVYLTDLFDGVNGITATEDRSGRLRLVREGATYTGYYLDAATDDWVLLHSGPGPEGDVFFAISAWSADNAFGDRPVQVTFDNYRLEAEQILLPVKPVGLEAPLAKLAPEGETPPLPRRPFNVGRTLPLNLKLLVAGRPAKAEDVAAPEIVALFRGGVPLNLSKLNLDGGKPGHDLHLRSSGRKWRYDLSTQGLPPGTYAIVLRMPDDRRYAARFVLRKRRR